MLCMVVDMKTRALIPSTILVAALAGVHDVAPEAIRPDVEEFLEDLRARDIVRAVGSSA